MHCNEYMLSAQVDDQRIDTHPVRRVSKHFESFYGVRLERAMEDQKSRKRQLALSLVAGPVIDLGVKC